MTGTAIYRSESGRTQVAERYNRLLGSWPTPRSTCRVPTRFGSTFVIAVGDPAAPPVVLLHGAGTSSVSWTGEVATYASRYRTYAVDLIGEPGFSAATRPSWAGSAYELWLRDVLAGLGIAEPVNLIGMSQGGWVALGYASVHPSAVRALVLLSPGGVVRDRPAFPLAAITLNALGRRGRRRLIRVLLADRSIDDDLEAYVLAALTHVRPRLGMLPLFSDRDLAQLTMPVLVMIGDRDALRDGRRIIARLETQVPHLTQQLVPGGGHALTGTAGTIVRFLHDAAA